jgi:hypothetical protein
MPEARVTFVWSIAVHPLLRASLPRIIEGTQRTDKRDTTIH